MSAPGTVAMADTGTLTTGFVASVVTAMLPVALPADCGVKVTVKLLRWPAARVSGKLSPFIRKSFPVTVAWWTVRFELPELIRVADWVWLVPIFTLPKARLVGKTASCPAAMPVPDRVALNTVGRVPRASLVSLPRRPKVMGRNGKFGETVPTTEIVPLLAPLAAGVK